MKRSDYERAVILELRVARIAAWTLYLATACLAFIWITGSRISIGGGAPMSAAHELLGCGVLFFAGYLSDQCEYRAENQLKDVWLARYGRASELP